MVGRYLVRVEGVNFASTLDDTQDLSTIRGSGLALLAIPAVVEAALRTVPGVTDSRLVLKGASLAAASFTGDPGAAAQVRQQITDSLQKAGPGGEPFAHLSFVVDVVRGDDARALQAAQSRNRARQFRQWTIDRPRFAEGNRAIDPLDRTRPASEPHDLQGDRALLSPSVAARRRYGRRMRQQFYDTHAPEAARRLHKAGLAFVDDFRALMDAPPQHLPVSTRSHLALVYADGNRFSAIARTIGAEAFSQALLPLQERLLDDVLSWFHSGALGPESAAFAVTDRGQMRLRIETLLWGGDELAFVMPAWLAFPFIEGFFELTRDWRVGGHALTFAVGAVFAHHKVPIRQVRALAEGVADSLKEACDTSKVAPNGILPSAASIEIFESLSVPEAGLEAYRKGLFGPEAADARFPLALALPAERIGDIRSLIQSLSQETEDAPIRRSQLYRVLAKARVAPDGLAGDEADGIADATLKSYASRVRGQSVGEAIRLPRLPGAPLRSLGVELAMLASFWDYADPFDGAVPAMTQGAAQ